MNKICGFQGPYRFLSNFWPSPIIADNGLAFATVEHAYQAAKSEDPKDWKDASECVSPGAAKRLGKTFTLRPDWNEAKVPLMAMLIKAKFGQTDLRMKLLATGEAELIEANNWGDTFWGVCGSRGENMLGHLLMQEREHIRQEVLKS